MTCTYSILVVFLQTLLTPLVFLLCSFINLTHRSDTNVWTKVETTGTGPSPRFYHSASLVGPNKLWVHGGWTGYARENDFFVLDLGNVLSMFKSSIMRCHIKYISHHIDISFYFLLFREVEVEARYAYEQPQIVRPRRDRRLVWPRMGNRGTLSLSLSSLPLFQRTTGKHFERETAPRAHGHSCHTDLLWLTTYIISLTHSLTLYRTQMFRNSKISS